MPDSKNKLARSLPAVDAVLQLPNTADLIAHFGKQAVTVAIRAIIDQARKDIMQAGTTDDDACSVSAIAGLVRQRLLEAEHPNLRRVVNATGIILHTGLGRAMMPEAARAELSVVSGYCNLQQDLQTGRRDRREDCIVDIVKELTGAEDVLVVNNNAGATFLTLAALARGKEVVISRGELIEIGGSFRLPDIMQESGAVLREVGTTNKTHLKDYENAVGLQTAMILKAHKSNYRIVGFTKEVGIAEIVKVGRKHGVPVVDDLGCGALVGLEMFGLEHECTVRESLEAGADVALFSTDKLIGGPQGGMIVGRAALLEKIRAHPLYRILRVCKLTLGALEATLRLFRAPDLLAKRHPVYRMIAKTMPEMESQASDLIAAIAKLKPGWKVEQSREVSYLGGGTLPETEMPSFAIRIRAQGLAADELALAFRTADTPVIPRVADGCVILDMRTIFPEDAGEILRAIDHVGTSVEQTT